MKTTSPVRRLALAVGVISVLLSAAGRSAAGESGDIPGYPQHVTSYDPREVSLLPKFCTYTQLFRDHVPGGNNPVEIERWHDIMGPVFIHMHHYCYGLMYLHRANALARDPIIRGYNYNFALNEFDYTLERTPSDFPLLPEMLTMRGEVLMHQGRAGQAQEAFERAISLKPDYWAPYAFWSDQLVKTGDLVQARAVLEKGLAQAPDSVGLHRRLTDLDAEKPKNKSASQ